ncbi:MAG: hypothetical protein IT210_19565 [Armatimonadetes bacterium]|nr:hypothetical protein [Armatimonadota bacterium]
MIGFWDILLIVAVSAQATVIAYVYDPRWKALVLTLPVPFTLASLSLGRPIDATNVLGLVALLLFTHLVRYLYYALRLNIVLSIALSALGYSVLGWLVSRILPISEASFWLAGLVAAAAALLAWRLTPCPAEEGHRTPLPVWMKAPLIVAVVLTLILAKKGLHGFMTVFPMVGVVAAYEARKCLWTICRQMPVLMLSLFSLMAVSHLASPHIGLGPSLAAGWVVFLGVLRLATRFILASPAG